MKFEQLNIIQMRVAYSGTSLPKFRYNLSVFFFLRVKKSKMGPTGCRETSANNHRSTLCNITEERRSHPHSRGSLQSRTLFK